MNHLWPMQKSMENLLTNIQPEEKSYEIIGARKNLVALSRSWQ